jgi:hypothetical protein
VCNPATGVQGVSASGGRQSGISAGLLKKKYIQRSFFDSMSEIQKDLEDFSAGIVLLLFKLFISILYKYVTI